MFPAYHWLSMVNWHSFFVYQACGRPKLLTFRRETSHVGRTSFSIIYKGSMQHHYFSQGNKSQGFHLDTSVGTAWTRANWGGRPSVLSAWGMTLPRSPNGEPISQVISDTAVEINIALINMTCVANSQFVNIPSSYFSPSGTMWDLL